MNSSDLARYGLLQWRRFNRAGERELLERAPEEPGVYVIRRRPRVSEEARNVRRCIHGIRDKRKGLRMRLRQYFHPGHLQRTNLWIIVMIDASDEFELSFVTLIQDTRSEYLEAALMEECKADHREYLPEQTASLTDQRPLLAVPFPTVDDYDWTLQSLAKILSN